MSDVATDSSGLAVLRQYPLFEQVRAAIQVRLDTLEFFCVFLSSVLLVVNFVKHVTGVLFWRFKQSNPQILPGLLQMIQMQNPELSELIANNQTEFLQMLAEGSDNVSTPSVDPAYGSGGTGNFLNETSLFQNTSFVVLWLGDSNINVHVTTEQQDVVRRVGCSYRHHLFCCSVIICDFVPQLVDSLGFPAVAVLQALVACEWNEVRVPPQSICELMRV